MALLAEPSGESIAAAVLPQTLDASHIVATNIPAAPPAWAADTIYPAGELVTHAGETWASALSDALAYSASCPTLYNKDIEPSKTAVVPYGDCGYYDAGARWWTQTDAALVYAELVLDPLVYSQAEVAGALSITLAPPIEYDTICLTRVHGMSTGIAVGAESATDDLELATPYAHTTHAEQSLYLLAAPTTSNVTVSVAARDGRSALGGIVVGKRAALGTGLASTTVGIVDYSRFDRDEFGHLQVRPRQNHNWVRFFVEGEQAQMTGIRLGLQPYTKKPVLIIGTDDPSVRHAFIVGLIERLSVPGLGEDYYGRMTIDVQAVATPGLVKGVPPTALEVPPLPDQTSLNWMAVGHADAPYVTVIDIDTWREIEVAFIVPGPVRALVTSYDRDWLILGHCGGNTHLTVVDTSTWTAIDTSAITLPATPLDMAFLRAAQVAAIAHDCAPYVTLLDVDETGVAVRATPPGILAHARLVEPNPIDSTLLVVDICTRLYRIDLDAETVEDFGTGYTAAAAFLGAGNGGRVLVGTTTAPYVALFDYPALTPVAMTATLTGQPHLIKVSRDGAYAAVAHQCAPYVSIIDLATLDTVATAFELDGPPCDMTWHAYSDYLALVYSAHPYGALIIRDGWTLEEMAYEEEDAA